MVPLAVESEMEAPETSDGCPCIYLSDDQVEALGIQGMPAPGTVFTLRARAVVERMTAEGEEPDEGEDSSPDVSLTLKITDMEVSPGGPSTETQASMLYGS